jgi:hypothetical protein
VKFKVGDRVRILDGSKKIGEWVKVITSPYSGEDKKIPYIVQCVGMSKGGKKLAILNGVGAHNKQTLGFEVSDYIVLENYQPPKEKEKPKPYNGKVVCISDVDSYISGFTKGKVYKVKNGKIRTDEKWTFPDGEKRLSSFEELEEYFKGKSERKTCDVHYSGETIKFLEVVE